MYEYQRRTTMARSHVIPPLIICVMLSYVSYSLTKLRHYQQQQPIVLAVTAACQLCIDKAVRTNIPISLRNFHTSNDVITNDDLRHTNKDFRSNPSSVSQPRRRPLHMAMLDDDNNFKKNSKSLPFNDTDINNNDDESFDSVAFFEELLRSNNNSTETTEKDQMSIAMIATIGFYKKIISPLLPPACRFLPTCSSYGVQAIQEFGPTKGCILIAWRILRCSPIGGKGYDPPRWPPVAYTYSSY